MKDYTMSLLKFELIRKGTTQSSLIFFPGGPGLSWHCFEALINSLETDCSIYGITYNQVSCNESTYFNEQAFELTLLLQTIPNPILVTHSFSSMFVLSLRRLPSLKGLVLISPAVDNSYLFELPQRLKTYTKFDGTQIAANFWINPSDTSYAEYFKGLLPFYFRPDYIEDGLIMLDQCDFTHLPYVLCTQHFYPTFTQSYTPEIPTLIISGDDDYICPPSLFKDSLIFKGNNIQMAIIPDAGHFPWVDSLDSTLTAFSVWHETIIRSLTTPSQ
ncbi:alpha/beta hydrolase [Candidatus Bodocaedibacter vickermanii]|uniref:Alpha/beta hydrolase n=2 Tax=Candidatus Bodocaedibacter vickermanii TaxID=2741701 RepID=A0A7L9RSH9_9PROT|nr:alpha/beta hydrolase [Candidatus Paracaedibacteraceae bacterium 'Lake Konstanz']